MRKAVIHPEDETYGMPDERAARWSRSNRKSAKLKVDQLGDHSDEGSSPRSSYARRSASVSPEPTVACVNQFPFFIAESKVREFNSVLKLGPKFLPEGRLGTNLFSQTSRRLAKAWYMHTRPKLEPSIRQAV